MSEVEFIKTVRPREFIRLKQWPLKVHYKLVANSKGLHLKRARFFETWGVLLGANLSHRLENGEVVALFGMRYQVNGDADGNECSISEVEDLA
jgi:hypothetical protein